MRGIAGAVENAKEELQAAAFGSKPELEDDFKEVMEEQMREQKETLNKIEKENALAGLNEVDKQVRMQFQSPHLVSIHRRIMADGSYLITEMKGNSLVSHYRKRLDCNKQKQMVAKDGESES